jgi:hypothetical protein
MTQYSLDGSSPQLIGDDVWLAPTAQVIGAARRRIIVGKFYSIAMWAST